MPGSKISLWLRPLFALLLLAVQGQLLAHQTDIEAHSESTACEFCMHFTQLDDGAIPALSTAFPAQNSVSLTPRPAVDVYRIPGGTGSARGPPIITLC